MLLSWIDAIEMTHFTNAVLLLASLALTAIALEPILRGFFG